MGIAAGAGLILGMDFMDTSFKDKKEIENFLQIPVTCALPLLVTETEKRRNKAKNILWYVLFAAWLVALAGALYYLKTKELIIF
jgi:hypothetical protein